MIPEERLTQLINRHQYLEHVMAEGGGGDDFVRNSREYAELTPIVEVAQELRRLRAEAADLEAMLADRTTDPDMRALAEEELPAIEKRIPELERQLQILLLPKDAADEKGAILEIRAGTGGEEAALFAADLYNMYQRYAELQGWSFEPISMSDSDLGGFKEVIDAVSGREGFARLTFESGDQ